MAVYQGVNFAKVHSSPVENISAADAGGRLRIARDFFDTNAQNLATGDTVQLGGTLIPEGAMVVGGAARWNNHAASNKVNIIVGKYVSPTTVDPTPYVSMFPTGSSSQSIAVTTAGNSALVPGGDSGGSQLYAVPKPSVAMILAMPPGGIAGALTNDGIEVFLYYTID